MRYAEGIKSRWWLGGLVFMGACGAPPELVGDDDADLGTDRFRPTTCVTCSVNVRTQLQSNTSSTSRIVALPTMLMFYGDATAPEGLAPQSVLVENDTYDPVEVTNAYIADATAGASGKGGADYFDVTFPDMTGKPLERGESVSLEVSFVASSVQRTALLVIETTHVTYPTLHVDLAGKYFTNSW